ncbi:MAG: helix-turn-helix transcriptional regulator [Phycisphaerae bacterium]|nr:helix-turn-helix transcriptional regulator [Phycisphaerae bacterium]
MVMFTGCPPTLFVRETHMRHPANLLRTTDLPVKIVAAQAGYEDIYYFTKCFRHHHARPPARYRHTHQRIGGDSARA